MNINFSKKMNINLIMMTKNILKFYTKKNDK